MWSGKPRSLLSFARPNMTSPHESELGSKPPSMKLGSLDKRDEAWERGLLATVSRSAHNLAFKYFI